MLRNCQGRDTHEKFRVMSALATAQSLTAQEFNELSTHLKHCKQCRTIAQQYVTLTTHGKQILLARYGQRTAAFPPIVRH